MGFIIPRNGEELSSLVADVCEGLLMFGRIFQGLILERIMSN